MEISICIKTPHERLVPNETDTTFDVSITGIAAQDMHLYGDARPLVMAVLDKYVEMSKLPQDMVLALKKDNKRLIYGEDA